MNGPKSVKKHYDSVPESPCELCTGKATNGQQSWEWCKSFNACGATIDWEAIAEDREAGHCIHA